jgi:aspartyl-tRNA(Asn)/glutamyl-tRNA(Gln) amidotransferase subunit A
MCLGSLGTDTRASIRVPAALCGVVGFKPTFGLISTQGVLTLSWSMDHVAPMARTIEDVALLLNVLVGPERGAGPTRRPVVDYRGCLHTDIAGLRVGAPTHGVRNAEAGVVHLYERALATLREAGAVVVEVPEPTVEDFETVNAAGLIVSRCEAAAFQRTLIGRDERYTAEVGDQLLEAEKVLAVDYVQAQRIRAEFATRMARLFERVDALALPTSRVIAPKANESEQYLLVLSENCVPWSLIGFPAVSVPGGLAPPGLPVGIQLVAAPYDDGLLIALGSALADRLGPPPSPPRPAVGRADSP